MTNVPIQDLKQRLAEYLGRVGRGERIVVTRRNRAVAELRPVGEPGLNRARERGTAAFEPLGFRLARGALAATLAEDRSDDR